MDSPLTGWIDPDGTLHRVGEHHDRDGNASLLRREQANEVDCCHGLCLFCASLNVFKHLA